MNDMHQLCKFYVKREKINNTFKDLNPSVPNDSKNLDASEAYSSRQENRRNHGSNSRNRSFSSFLSQQEAYSGFESLSINNPVSKSFAMYNKSRQQSLGNNQKLSQYNSVHSLSSFCMVNELEKSMSYVERAAKKLLPILQEVKKRMIKEKKLEGLD